jgi:hypothetical protein
VLGSGLHQGSAAAVFTPSRLRPGILTHESTGEMQDRHGHVIGTESWLVEATTTRPAGFLTLALMSRVDGCLPDLERDSPLSACSWESIWLKLPRS